MSENMWKEKYEKAMDYIKLDIEIWSDLQNKAFDESDLEKFVRLGGKKRTCENILDYMETLYNE